MRSEILVQECVARFDIYVYYAWICIIVQICQCSSRLQGYTNPASPVQSNPSCVSTKENVLKISICDVVIKQHPFSFLDAKTNEIQQVLMEKLRHKLNLCCELGSLFDPSCCCS